MRIHSLQLSNILSFNFTENIEDAFELQFDPSLNIIIGGNGSGKSTALEAVNFVFSRVLFKAYKFNESNYNDTRLQQNKAALAVDENNKRITPFRLNPNWNTETDEQRIRVVIVLDEIDISNIEQIVDNYSNIKPIVEKYSDRVLPAFTSVDQEEVVKLSVQFTGNDDSYAVQYESDTADYLRFYLEHYELLNEAISIYNERSDNKLSYLSNTFTMLSAFRNYSSFSEQASLQSSPRVQLRQIRTQNSNRSNNQQDGQPSIFNVVKIRLGGCHYDLMQEKYSRDDATRMVNQLEIVNNINSKLQVLDLKFLIEVIDTRSWSYKFKFYDMKHERDLGDINNLSAGQRSIIHLIFEAYGHDDMRGGVVIIDEPEIHLHYQYQFEYLRILEKLNNEKNTQYILVTHSEGFISSNTARYLKRFALDENRHSIVRSPELTTRQKKLIEILDNTQASRALFANKVILVEGQDDQYFFRSVLKEHKPEHRQEIAVYDTRGKDSIPSWSDFFGSFGLQVFAIKDLDATGKDFYDNTVTFKSGKPTSTTIEDYKDSHSDLEDRIEAEYSNGVFYLKAGAIEQYTERDKDLKHVIDFCENMSSFLGEGSELSSEIINIIDTICDY